MPIAYEISGVDRGGPTLVLIHGWNCDRRYWAQAAERLAEHFRVVALDLGGHGESGTDRADWSIASFGEDVASVVRDQNLRRVVLVGHSMGGPVALDAAARLPGRVIGVIGVDTFHAVDDPPPADLEDRLEPFRRDLPTALATLDPIFFAPSTDPALADWIRRDMAAAPPRVSTPALRSLVRYDEFAALATLDVPAAAINADIQRTNVDALRRARPGFEVVIVEDAGHFLMMEKPDEFARELRGVITGWTSIASSAAAAPVSGPLPAASTQ
ncbi:MAG: alpha/beta hydrolase [Gammaproteobacteria bacterium]